MSEDDWGDLEINAEAALPALANRSLDAQGVHAMEGALQGMDDEDDDDWGDLDLSAATLGEAMPAPSSPQPAAHPAGAFGMDLEVMGSPGGGGKMLQLRLRSDAGDGADVTSGEEGGDEPSATYNRAKQQWEGGHAVDMSGFESSGDENGTEESTGHTGATSLPLEADEDDDWGADFDEGFDLPGSGGTSMETSPLAEVTRRGLGQRGGPTLITMDDLAAQGIDVAALAAAQAAAVGASQPAEMLEFYREDDDELEGFDEAARSGIPQAPEAQAGSPLRPAGHTRTASGPKLLRPEDVALAEMAGQGGQQSVYDADRKRWVQVGGVYVGALEPKEAPQRQRRPSTTASTGSGNRGSNPEDFELPRAVASYFRRCESEHQDVMRLILGEGLFRRLRREGKDRLKARSPYLQRGDDSSDATSDSGHSDEFGGDLEDAGNGYNRLGLGTPETKRARKRRSERRAEATESGDSGPGSGGRRWNASTSAGGRRRGGGASAAWVRPSGPVRAQKPAAVDRVAVEAAAATRSAPLRNIERVQILAAHERQLRRFEEARRLALGRPELV